MTCRSTFRSRGTKMHGSRARNKTCTILMRLVLWVLAVRRPLSSVEATEPLKLSSVRGHIQEQWKQVHSLHIRVRQETTAVGRSGDARSGMVESRVAQVVRKTGCALCLRWRKSLSAGSLAGSPDSHRPRLAIPHGP